MKVFLLALCVLLIVNVMVLEIDRKKCLSNGGEWKETGNLILTSTYPTPVFANEMGCFYPKTKGEY